MKMISVPKAIELGVKTYSNEYEDAITALWKHNTQITPEINILSFLLLKQFKKVDLMLKQ